MALTWKRGDESTELKMVYVFNDIGHDRDIKAGLMEIRHVGWRPNFVVQGIGFR